MSENNLVITDKNLLNKLNNIQIDVQSVKDDTGAITAYKATVRDQPFEATARTEAEAVRACKDAARKAVTKDGPSALFTKVV